MIGFILTVWLVCGILGFILFAVEFMIAWEESNHTEAFLNNKKNIKMLVIGFFIFIITGMLGLLFWIMSGPQLNIERKEKSED